MDAFFVSVELLDRPDLRGKPLSSADVPTSAVSFRASYEARKIRNSFRHGRCAPPESCALMQFFSTAITRNTPSGAIASLPSSGASLRSWKCSVDEAYLDFAGTERMHGPPLAATDKLLRTITRETAFPAPAASRRRALTAKVGERSSQTAWPRLGRARPGSKFLAPLPVRRFPVS